MLLISMRNVTENSYSEIFVLYTRIADLVKKNCSFHASYFKKIGKKFHYAETLLLELEV